MVFCFIGAFALRNDMADVWLTMLFGVLGFFMRRYDLPIPPLVMGVILGPMAEQYFLTSMVAHGNDLTRVRDAPGERGDPGPGGAAGAGAVAQAAAPRGRLSSGRARPAAIRPWASAASAMPR